MEHSTSWPGGCNWILIDSFGNPRIPANLVFKYLCRSDLYLIHNTYLQFKFRRKKLAAHAKKASIIRSFSGKKCEQQIYSYLIFNNLQNISLHVSIEKNMLNLICLKFALSLYIPQKCTLLDALSNFQIIQTKLSISILRKVGDKDKLIGFYVYGRCNIRPIKAPF